MTWLSHNEMWEAFGTRALFWAGTGSDFGEVKNTIGRIGAGDVHIGIGNGPRRLSASSRLATSASEENIPWARARHASALRRIIGPHTIRCLVQRWSLH